MAIYSSLWGAPDDDLTNSTTRAITQRSYLKVTATGNAQDGNLTGAVIVHDVDLSTGIVKPNNAETSQMFGGALDDPGDGTTTGQQLDNNRTTTGST